MQRITADRIHISPGAFAHTTNTLLQALDRQIILKRALDPNKIMAEIRTSIPRGVITDNLPAGDVHNPNDRQLSIYTILYLDRIDRYLKGNVKLFVNVRLSVMNGTLSLRNISRNIAVEGA